MKCTKIRAHNVAELFDKYNVVIPKGCCSIGVNLGWNGADTTTFRFYDGLSEEISRETVETRASGQNGYRIAPNLIENYRVTKKNDDGLTMTGTINITKEKSMSDMNTEFVSPTRKPLIRFHVVGVGNGFIWNDNHYIKSSNSRDSCSNSNAIIITDTPGRTDINAEFDDDEFVLPVKLKIEVVA